MSSSEPDEVTGARFVLPLKQLGGIKSNFFQTLDTQEAEDCDP